MEATQTCQRCHEPFALRRDGGSPKKYCSPQCGALFRSSGPVREVVVRPCACCHDLIQIRAYGGVPQRFCSKQCAAKYRDRGPDLIERACEECGEQIPASRRINARYCSHRCGSRVSGRASYMRTVQGDGDWRERKRRFGVDRERYEAMLADQGGRCAVCRTDEPGGRGSAFPWHIDHDHACCPGYTTCGKCVRGLVCQRCNHGLGYFRDDPQILRAAALYVEGK